jgi:hypothetical protein
MGAQTLEEIGEREKYVRYINLMGSFFTFSYIAVFLLNKLFFEQCINDFAVAKDKKMC